MIASVINIQYMSLSLLLHTIQTFSLLLLLPHVPGPDLRCMTYLERTRIYYTTLNLECTGCLTFDVFEGISPINRDTQFSYTVPHFFEG